MTTFPPSSTSSGSETPSPSSSPGARPEAWSSALGDKRALRQRALQVRQHAHDAEPRLGACSRLRPVADALEEVPALDPQGLLVRHPRRVDVARAGDVLAV